MEVMSALCDKTVREAANEGLVVPPVDGIVDGSNDTPADLLLFTGIQASAKREEEANPEGNLYLWQNAHVLILKREAAAAAQSEKVIDSMLASQYRG